MDLTNLQDLQTAMKLAGIKPKKGLGQHFLVDKPSLEAIVAAGELTKADTVLEIGPGLGTLTQELSNVAGKVVAVETDMTLAQMLQRADMPNLEVVAGDFLKFDLSVVDKGYKVVANIPYYVTAPIIRALMESNNPPSVAVLLIQKEVAERITAKPGNLSVLALSVQYYAEPEIVEIVERQKFWPAPNVDSAVLRLKVRPQPLFEAESKALFRLIKAGFGEKRKQLKNSLAGGLNCSVEMAGELLTTAGIDPMLRAQALSLLQWKELYNAAKNLQLI